MPLYFIGAGLGDLEDLTVRGLRILEKSEYIYLEAYTSVQRGTTPERLAARFPRAKVVVAYRELVESGCEEMLKLAVESCVSFLVIGDPMCATTHSDLYLRARVARIDVQIVHNASIINAIGCTGLQLYRFGQIVSIPFFDGSWRPDSFIEKIESNLKSNLHTLCLLDIKVREQSVENMVKRNAVYEPPRFMSAAQAAAQIIEVLKPGGLLTESSLVCAVARVGSPDEQIVYTELGKVPSLGEEGLQSLVVCAPKLHELEAEFARRP